MTIDDAAYEQHPAGRKLWFVSRKDSQGREEYLTTECTWANSCENGWFASVSCAKRALNASRQQGANMSTRETELLLDTIQELRQRCEAAEREYQLALAASGLLTNRLEAAEQRLAGMRAVLQTADDLIVDLRLYAADWDWKYGQSWDNDQKAVKAALSPANTEEAEDG